MANESTILRALLQRPLGPLPAGTLGPGDDGCVLPLAALGAGSLVATCDALEEGVHFRRGWLSMADLAHKLIAVSVSDAAAMGADPVGVLVAIAWSRRDPAEAAREFGVALQEACAAWSCHLLGGDTDVREGSLRLEATLLARCDRPLLRSTGRAGDALFVTGPLGGAALAVQAWEQDVALDAADEAQADALSRFRRPYPRLDASRALRGVATAAIDLSDGLRSDAGTLARASGLTARLHAQRIPLHPAVQARQDGLSLALDGGEDYELLVAGPQTLMQEWPGLVRVGELCAGDAGAVIVT